MLSGASSFSIQELARLLKIRVYTKKPILFLGSRAGGLFKNPELYQTLGQFSLRTFGELNDFEKFAECYRQLNKPGYFSETDIDGFLKTALRGISVTYADIFIADLLKQKVFEVIITTCIDDVLEQALNRIGQRELFDFSIRTPKPDSIQDQVMQLEPQNNEAVIIWKIFGDITSLSYNVNNRVAQVNRQEDLKKVFEETKSRDLLMVGFDPVWDVDIVPALFPRQGHAYALWFVNDQPPAEMPQISRYLNSSHAKYISGAEGNHRNFFQELHFQITGNIPALYHIEPEFLREFSQMKNELELLRREVQRVAALLFQMNNDRASSADEK